MSRSASAVSPGPPPCSHLYAAGFPPFPEAARKTGRQQAAEWDPEPEPRLALPSVTAAERRVYSVTVNYYSPATGGGPSADRGLFLSAHLTDEQTEVDELRNLFSGGETGEPGFSPGLSGSNSGSPHSPPDQGPRGGWLVWQGRWRQSPTRGAWAGLQGESVGRTAWGGQCGEESMGKRTVSKDSKSAVGGL